MSETITVHFVEPDGRVHDAQGKVGRSLMLAAVDAGIDGIKADCGGLMSCATCHVIVVPGWIDRLPPLTSDEDAMLEMTASPREAASRLACQIELDAGLAGLTVGLPETQY